MNDLMNAHEYGKDLRERNKAALKSNKTIITSLRLPVKLLVFYDQLVKDGSFLSRSEAIRYSLHFYKDLKQIGFKRR